MISEAEGLGVEDEGISSNLGAERRQDGASRGRPHLVRGRRLQDQLARTRKALRRWSASREEERLEIGRVVAVGSALVETGDGVHNQHGVAKCQSVG